MKKVSVVLFLTLLISTLINAQKNIDTQNASCQECQQIWEKFRMVVINKKIDSTVQFFTDSMVVHYVDYEDRNLREFITKSWFGEAAFITSLKSKKYKLKANSDNSFNVQVAVSFPKKAGEDGDGKIVYILQFRKGKKGYQISNLDMAD